MEIFCAAQRTLIAMGLKRYLAYESALTVTSQRETILICKQD